ncbi:entericidin EcnAB [Vibrio coralliilyticus]|nr:entericidin EcnAB [Vibrio coralliilyticus]WFB50845.1 entericidin EcnAB [Vibrio coralliilyticus]
MRVSLIVTTIALLIGGCSNTWQGVKDDSSKVWGDTKQAIHEATAEE